MAKFTTDYVNLIANNLRDRYKTGFPVLKELVQNADDAGASSLIFGYHRGYEDKVNHPLLVGPALWILNNGRFIEQDREAIRSFGLNSKAAETGSIGKFGLGMKSVFHLCEAFFYIASDGSQNFYEILSPWFQDTGSHEMYQRWEEITQKDREALLTTAVKDLKASEGKSWFMLWVPLRQKAHVPQIEGQLHAPIIDRFPGDKFGKDLDFFTEQDIERRIGQLLPLLRNLEQISFMGTDTLAAFKLQLKLHEKNQRLDHATDGLQTQGRVVNSGTTKNQLQFFATQTLKTGVEPFNKLQASDFWPKSNAIIEGGRRAPVPDKAQPEGAVMFSHADKRSGYLTLQWAVFLPTEEGRYRYEVHIPNSSREYSITLHGQFFVDAGRRGIDGMEQLSHSIADESKWTTEAFIHLAWNQALAQQLTLPAFLPGLANYVQAEAFSDNEITTLTRALVDCSSSGDLNTKTHFVKTYINHLCRKYSWVRTLRLEGANWELVAAGEKFLQLPPPPKNNPSIPWQVLPRLHDLREFIFIENEAPHIYQATWHWSDERLVASALSQIPISVLSNQAELKYLLAFLNLHKDRALQTSIVQQQLVQQIRLALWQTHLSDIRKHKALFTQLIELLPAKLKFGLGTRRADAKGAISEYLYQELLVTESEALLLPADLMPDSDNGQPSKEDIALWLIKIDELIRKDKEFTQALEVVEPLLKSIGNEKAQAELLRSYPSLHILSIFDVRKDKIVAVSLDALSDQLSKQLVFRSPDALNRLGLSKKLSQAVTSLEIYVVRADVEKILRNCYTNEKIQIPSANDEKAIFSCIGKQEVAPELGDIQFRADLLNHVSGINEISKAEKFGIRYLLHGEAQKFKSEEKLWKDPSGQESIWVRLWRMIEKDTWNVLPGKLSAHIPDKCSQSLGIHAVEKATIVNKLKHTHEFESVETAYFTEVDLDEILGFIDDETTWKKLPLHCDQHGNFGSISGLCYRQNNELNLPFGIGENLRFISPSRNPSHDDRQIKFISSWTSHEAAKIVLATDDPSQHWQYLIDILQEPLPFTSLVGAWAEKAWLPLASGGAISPSKVIQLEGMESDISKLSDQYEYKYAGLGDLSDDLKQHPGFKQLKKLIPSGAKALPMLAALMQAVGIHIPNTLADKAELLEKHQNFLRDLPSQQTGWLIVFKAIAATSIKEASDHLLRAIAQPLNTNEAEKALHDLSKKNLMGGRSAIYEAYLHEWLKSASVEELRPRLQELKLWAANESWKLASELVSGTPGVDEIYRLHPRTEAILRNVVIRNDVLPAVDGLDDGEYINEDLPTALAEWCEPFEQSSIRPAVGALIGLFGSNTKKLASYWLAPISYEAYIDQLGWKDPGYEGGASRRKRWMGGHSTPEKPFTLIQPNLIPVSASDVQVKSLTGEVISVPLASKESIKTLLAGSLKWLGGYGVEVRVRPIEHLHSFGLIQQKKILRQTAEDLWKELYNQDHPNLESLWSLFEDADQVELDIAQSLILEGLPQLIEQLSKVKKEPLIKEVLEDIDQCRRHKASAEKTNSGIQDATEKLRIARNQLSELVKTESTVQKALLAAVQEKIKSYHYERSSIPFEILQNADDAVVEYQDMLSIEHRPPIPQDDIGRFVLADDSNQNLMFIHWGRPINYTGRGDSAKQEYGKDLERMLMLGASAKDPQEGVTGKFGLGFKSVLLATDSPIVASGDLHFKIVAGCLPQRSQLSPSIQEMATRYKRPNLRSTVIELPLKEKNTGFIQRFKSLAGVCTVFTKQIKHIEINDEIHSWSPVQLLESSDASCELGKVQIPTKRGSAINHLLVFRCKHGAVAVRLDGKIIPFDRGGIHPVPAIWVTAPTQGTDANGILLNANFEIDTGRGSLPQGNASKNNHYLAEKLAESIAPVLSDLVEQSKDDWPAWSQRLAADPQLSAANFWYEAWSVMFGEEVTEDTSQDMKIISIFMKKLFMRVLDRTGVVPNGMPKPWDTFALQTQLRLSINYNYLKPVLPALEKWPEFVNTYPLNSWCSEDMAVWIKDINNDDEEYPIDKLERESLMNALGSRRRLTPNQMNELAKIITVWPQGPNEAQGWHNELAKLNFQSKSGTWHTANQLYFGMAEEDNLAQFLPENYVLDEKYLKTSDAWKIIYPYLNPRQLQGSEIAKYCLSAKEEDHYFVVEWLASNLDNIGVWLNIRSLRQADNWLFQINSNHPLLSNLEQDLSNALLGKLGVGFSSSHIYEEDEADESPASSLDLHTIHRWWMAHREQHLEKYEQGLWPQWIDKTKLADEDIPDRETWMALFSLGVFRRFGRAKDEQHRGFLDFLKTRGWWLTIAEVHPDHGAEQWMNILREYAETNHLSGDFEQWMDSFPRLYRLARWCDDYIELFRGLQLRNQDEAMHLLTPAADSSLSGSGFDAPTIHRTLRMGHSLVIRELLRAGVLNSKVAQSMAFMPKRAVIDLLKEMGYVELKSSNDIYNLLVNELEDSELACFGGDYDIPLIVLADNPNLQQEVVDWIEEEGL